MKVEVEAALQRVETGFATMADAETIRQYVEELEHEHAADVCMELRQGLSELFSCSQHGEFQRIHTHFLYPDGDHIDLFVRANLNVVTVSDFGETLRWLRSQTLSQLSSANQDAMINDICLAHGVELYKGMLLARCRHGDAMAAVVLRVAQAALLVSGLWFAFRNTERCDKPSEAQAFGMDLYDGGRF